MTNIVHQRCVDEEKLFPVSNPVLCAEKSVNPFMEAKCCGSDNCNKFIRFELPKRGEMKYIPANKHHQKHQPPPQI